MSITYSDYVATLANLLVVNIDNPNFLQVMPTAIDYAEGRLYRELDLLSTRISNSTGSLSANNRNFTLPVSSGPFRVVESVSVITPAGSTAANGTRNQLSRLQQRNLDFLFPTNISVSPETIPVAFAPLDNATIIVGPPPGDAFVVEVIGTTQPEPLSASNPTTYLTTYLPDLMIAAGMIYLTGWQKNFGSQSDSPQQAVSWEAQYQLLMQSAALQNNKAKFSETMSRAAA